MKILTLLGSPRKKGNTAAVLSAFEERVPQGHTVQRINVCDYQIHGCLGCDSCQRKLDRPGCAQKDNAASILDRVMAADVVVYASPLYMWDFTAQMKALLDRHFCLTKWGDDRVIKSFVAGKKVMLLVTCGGEVENNADVIQTVFEREMECASCAIIGKYIVPNCTKPRELGARRDQTAEAMVSDLLSDRLGRLYEAPG